MYGSWDIKRKGQSFFVILGHVLTFDPPNNPKNQSFEKKTPGDISILHLCNTKWRSYDVWFLRYWTRQTEFFLVLDHFLDFYAPPPNNRENQNFEKMKKKQMEISSFYTSVP